VPLPKKKQPPTRIQVQHVEPAVDGGRYPVKRTEGERVEVFATIFKDGHDVLGAAIRFKRAGATSWLEEPLRPLGNDRFGGGFTVGVPGRWCWRIEAWTDRVATFRDELRRKHEAGQEDLSSELAEGAALLGRDALSVEEALALDDEDRHGKAWSDTFGVDVDRKLARFGSWYELFPRSWGGFRGVAEELPRIGELGFDVVYLPPIHPIGSTNRKGRNNAVAADPGDVGSPWAIGSPEGGHHAINPELGTWEDFDAMIAAGRAAGVEIALDLAIQCSPDHPWLKEHPDWFNRRPDGTLKYAENPPKRYQDIYNLNFESSDWAELWGALLEVVRGWVRRGVTVFRVDNPHTKPVPFWEWLISEIRAERPEVIFLAEAFTRPAMMTTLAKIGFAQSYTYFTWKNTKAELVELMEEVVAWSPFYRPNFFTNTQDILHAYLVEGGPPAFEARLVLAATLSPAYGIYSGFEAFENVPLRPGSEEYLDSEKYEAKARTLDGPLLPLVQRLNEMRRAEPALQRVENVRFLETENEQLVAYVKDDVVCVVNIDPFGEQEGACIVPVALGWPPAFDARELLTLQLAGRPQLREARAG